MNISQQLPSLPIATAVNPATETLRRDNNQREIIVKPEAASQSAADKGVASEKDKNRTPAQNNEQVDFESIRKRAELEGRSIGDGSGRDSESSSGDSPSGSSSDSSGKEAKGEAEPEKSPSETFQEEQVLNDLKQRDAEVRSHERAHAAIGGAATGAPSYAFETGPDGKKYAVSGEVSVDLSQVSGNPRATIAKMQKVHAAALAPANPSIQDTRVAASAARIITQAQSELLAEGLEFTNKTSSESAPTESSISERSAANHIKANQVLADDESSASVKESKAFDQLMHQTLQSQEPVVTTRPQEVIDRASRIESFYSNINHAYEKGPTYQFELTA